MTRYQTEQEIWDNIDLTQGGLRHVVGQLLSRLTDAQAAEYLAVLKGADEYEVQWAADVAATNTTKPA